MKTFQQMSDSELRKFFNFPEEKTDYEFWSFLNFLRIFYHLDNRKDVSNVV
jgi:hypothetical protein